MNNSIDVFVITNDAETKFLTFVSEFAVGPEISFKLMPHSMHDIKSNAFKAYQNSLFEDITNSGTVQYYESIEEAEFKIDYYLLDHLQDKTFKVMLIRFDVETEILGTYDRTTLKNKMSLM